MNGIRRQLKRSSHCHLQMFRLDVTTVPHISWGTSTGEVVTLWWQLSYIPIPFPSLFSKVNTFLLHLNNLLQFLQLKQQGPELELSPTLIRCLQGAKLEKGCQSLK